MLSNTLKKELDNVSRSIQEMILTKELVVQRTLTTALGTKGKRIRAGLVLLAGALGSHKKDRKKLRKAAIMVELLHLASLVHDDILDDEQFRRNKKTVNAAQGEGVALFAGNYFISHVFQLAYRLNFEQQVTNVVLKMCSSELNQLNNKKIRLAPSLLPYLRINAGKTALLLSCSCQFGASLAKLKPKEIFLLGKYGFYLGLAYQLQDDLQDLFCKEASDLSRSQITLPFAYAHSKSKRVRLLFKLFYQQPDIVKEELLMEIEAAGAKEFTLGLIQKTFAKAVDSLRKLAYLAGIEDLEHVLAMLKKRIG
ncbi:MAG: hypothetical protein RLZ12_58 [Bacillota bacterium]|jgi:heptaprenyl diphosphate synthase